MLPTMEQEVQFSYRLEVRDKVFPEVLSLILLQSMASLMCHNSNLCSYSFNPYILRQLYWTDWGASPRIERISYDGSTRQTLHSFNLFWPNALTLDLSTQTLYWADAGLDRIECSSTDGTGRRLLMNQFIYHPFGIDFDDGTLYWTDWQLKAVLKSTITHDTTQSRYTINGVVTNLLKKPMGIKIISLSKQPLGEYQS